MALFVHHSPYSVFDRYMADQYRQMAAEMELMRRRMFQLVPPEALLIPVPAVLERHDDEPCMELEPLVPIVEENGERKLKMEFNVKEYKPDEVKVNLLDNRVLQVSANHEDKNEAGQTRRRLFLRQYRLPKGVDVDHLSPSLSKDGVLTIEAPAPGLAPSERLIPIQYQSEGGADQSDQGSHQ